LGTIVLNEDPPPDPSVPKTLDAALRAAGGLDRVRDHVAKILSSPDTYQNLLRPDKEVHIGLPFRPGNIICVGRNYSGHIKETGAEVPKYPTLFAKLTSSLIGPNEPILLPLDSMMVDYEAELAVVIGRRCRRVSAEEALAYVAGYTCLNDVSARDFQQADGQWVRAKSQDTFCPMGPYLVTTDEIPNPQNLTIRCLVNGQIRQDSNTARMIFPVAELIAFISRGITLEPGDLISTGTPDGVGIAMKPPVFLQDGDQVVVEIEQVGRLTNLVGRIV
jgi:2-keto-4-pentenoate hydratase/2-oxohepta-3-ene-1,7-dioic acid hydratase in catechol pathway